MILSVTMMALAIRVRADLFILGLWAWRCRAVKVTTVESRMMARASDGLRGLALPG